VFNRADTLWIVFDSNADIDLSALDSEPSRTIRGAEFTHAPDADIVRIKLDHPHLASVDIDGPTWTVQIGDTAIDTTRSLTMSRNLIGPNRSSVTIPFDSPHLVHRLDDPDAGDTLVVVTAFAPARGFLNSTFTETPTSLNREQRPTVMINPDDAAALGIADGDKVTLGNRRGQVQLHAKLFDGVRRGVLIAESLWPNSAYADGRGINTLTGADSVAPYGGAAFHDNKVWLKKLAN